MPGACDRVPGRGRAVLLWSLLAGLALLAAGLHAPARAQAFEPFEIEDMRVEGLERLETGAVFRNIELEIGSRLDAQASGEVIRKLFATGVFRDVQLRREGNVLVIVVVENPTISEVGILGMSEFDEEEVLAELAEVDIAESVVLRRDAVDRAVTLLRNRYIERAFFGVNIIPTVTPLERNRVRIDLEVEEGEIAKIKSVEIFGVEKEDPDDVLDEMTLAASNWLSWYNRDDVFSSAVFQGDIERIRDYYLERGYLRFEVVSPEVQVTRERDAIRISVMVSEGEQYRLGKWDYSGDLVIDRERFDEVVELVEGEIHSAAKVEATADAIKRLLGNASYARADVAVDQDIDDEGRTVSVDFVIDSGPPIYVRRIDISGNVKTRDEVIRRELRQFEGALYSAEQIVRSQKRLRRLGFFDSVEFEERPVEGTDDQVDLALKVDETSRGTGSISFGVGYSDSSGVIFSGSLRTDNVFGTGNDFEIEAERSDTVERFSFNLDQPFVTEDGISRHIGLALSRIENDDEVTNYQIEGSDFDYGYGIPVGEESVLYANVHIDQEKVVNAKQIIDQEYDICPDGSRSTGQCDGMERATHDDPEALAFLRRYGDDTISFLGSATLSRDSRDSVLAPTSGYRQSYTARATFPFGDLRYYSLRFLHSHFFRLDREGDYTLGMLGEIGYADAYGGHIHPFYRRYFLGGPSTLRGFDSGSIGPKDDDGDALGGKLRTRGGLDFYFPMPVLGEFDGVRTSFFLDAGGVFPEASDFDLGEFSAAGGFTIRWLSPVGPFKFVLAWPIKSQEGDETRSFDFTLGIF